MANRVGQNRKKKRNSEEFPFLLPEPWISKRISGRGEEDAADPVRPLGMWSHFVPEEIFDEKAFPVGRADWLMHPEQMLHAVLHFVNIFFQFLFRQMVGLTIVDGFQPCEQCTGDNGSSD